MEQEVYTVNNAEMSGVFDFANGRFIEGRVAGEKWRSFFANSLLSQKCVLHDFIYSGKTCKIRVKHSSEGKQTCQAKSTLTIKRSDLVPNREKFKFSNKSTNQPCTCKQGESACHGNNRDKITHNFMFQFLTMRLRLQELITMYAECVWYQQISRICHRCFLLEAREQKYLAESQELA